MKTREVLLVDRDWRAVAAVEVPFGDTGLPLVVIRGDQAYLSSPGVSLSCGRHQLLYREVASARVPEDEEKT